MKYRLSLIVLLLLVVVGASSGAASAHVLKQDNGTTAVLHIPPEDNPKANQPTDLDLFFSNRQHNFNIQDCDCGISVVSNGKVIQTVTPRPAQSGDTVDIVGTVNFPAIGIYNVIVAGSSKTGVFKPFKLDYLERVAVSATIPAPQNNGSQVVIISDASFLVLLMIAYSMIRNGGRYKKSGTAV